jgi:hypothetical protein
MPTHEEIEAIELITGHVAEAIMWSRSSQFLARPDRHQSGAPKLKLVSNNQEACEPTTQLVALVENLRSKAADLDRYANRAESDADAEALRKTAELSRMLIANIMLQIELVSSRNSAR